MTTNLAITPVRSGPFKWLATPQEMTCKKIARPTRARSHPSSIVDPAEPAGSGGQQLTESGPEKVNSSALRLSQFPPWET